MDVVEPSKAEFKCCLFSRPFLDHGGRDALSFSPSSTMTSCFAELPAELILLIFDFAARTSRSAALAISLVSKWGRELALPALYDTASLRTSVEFARFCLALGIDISKSATATPLLSIGSSLAKGLKLKREKWPGESEGKMERAKLVKNLWLPAKLHKAIRTPLPALFNACTSLQHLALPSNAMWALVRSLAGSTAGGSQITHLTITTPTLQYDWTEYISKQHGRALLSKITHLTILESAESAYVPCVHLPALTHLALAVPPMYTPLASHHDRNLISFARQYLDPCSSLQMLVLHLYEPTTALLAFNLRKPARDLCKYDARIHLLCSGSPKDINDFRSIWGRRCEGREGIWGVARDFVREAVSPTPEPAQTDVDEEDVGGIRETWSPLATLKLARMGSILRRSRSGEA